MKRIDGTVPGYYAIKHDLPAPKDRPNPDTVAASDRWILHMPGQAPWKHYALCCCSLADFPGVAPAKKHFPEATHEVQLIAIDPDFPQERLDKGGIAPLEPLNYIAQVVTTDAGIIKLVEMLAVKFVNGDIPAEPQGITVHDEDLPDSEGESARDWFKRLCVKWAKEIEA